MDTCTVSHHYLYLYLTLIGWTDKCVISTAVATPNLVVPWTVKCSIFMVFQINFLFLQTWYCSIWKTTSWVISTSFSSSMSSGVSPNCNWSESQNVPTEYLHTANDPNHGSAGTGPKPPLFIRLKFGPSLPTLVRGTFHTCCFVSEVNLEVQRSRTNKVSVKALGFS